MGQIVRSEQYIHLFLLACFILVMPTFMVVGVMVVVLPSG